MRSAANGELELLEQRVGPRLRPAAGAVDSCADHHEVLGAGEELVEGGVLTGDADDPARRRRRRVDDVVAADERCRRREGSSW